MLDGRYILPVWEIPCAVGNESTKHIEFKVRRRVEDWGVQHNAGLKKTQPISNQNAKG